MTGGQTVPLSLLPHFPLALWCSKHTSSSARALLLRSAFCAEVSELGSIWESNGKILKHTESWGERCTPDQLNQNF